MRRNLCFARKICGLVIRKAGDVWREIPLKSDVYPTDPSIRLPRMPPPLLKVLVGLQQRNLFVHMLNSCYNESPWAPHLRCARLRWHPSEELSYDGTAVRHAALRNGSISVRACHFNLIVTPDCCISLSMHSSTAHTVNGRAASKRPSC